MKRSLWLCNVYIYYVNYTMDYMKFTKGFETFRPLYKKTHVTSNEWWTCLQQTTCYIK